MKAGLALPSLCLFLLAAGAYADGAVDWKSTDRTLYCIQGQAVHFQGHYNSQGGVDQLLLTADRRVVATANASGTNEGDYDFTWTPDGSGPHTVKIMAGVGNGHRELISGADVYVLDSPPVSVTPATTSSMLDVPVTIATAAHGSFRATRIQVSYDGAPVSLDGAQLSKFTLPCSGSPTGAHTAVVEVFDSEGDRCELPPIQITVPERFALTVDADIYRNIPVDKARVSISFPDGMKPASVTYYIAQSANTAAPPPIQGSRGGRGGGRVSMASSSTDETPLLTTTTAPFGATLDLAEFESGAYIIHARVAAANGATFDTPSYTMNFHNIVLQAERDRKAQEEADRQAAIAVAQAQAAQAQAQAEEAQAARDRAAWQVMGQHPKAPLSAAAQQSATMIKTYLANNPVRDADGNQAILVEVADVKKSDSLAYPYDVLAIIGYSKDNTDKVTFHVNVDTGEVSDWVKGW